MNKYLKYSQGELIINTSGQKMYEITDDVNAWIKKEEISGGQLTIFIKHTSASLCIQENASEDVIEDILHFFKKLVPLVIEFPFIALERCFKKLFATLGEKITGIFDVFIFLLKAFSETLNTMYFRGGGGKSYYIWF